MLVNRLKAENFVLDPENGHGIVSWGDEIAFGDVLGGSCAGAFTALMVLFLVGQCNVGKRRLAPVPSCYSNCSMGFIWR